MVTLGLFHYGNVNVGYGGRPYFHPTVTVWRRLTSLCCPVPIFPVKCSVSQSVEAVTCPGPNVPDHMRTCVFWVCVCVCAAQLRTASMELISQMRLRSWSMICFSCWFFCFSFCRTKELRKTHVLKRTHRIGHIYRQGSRHKQLAVALGGRRTNQSQKAYLQ